MTLVALASESDQPRPRERILSEGPRDLRTHELLGEVLGVGTPGLSAEQLADRLLADTGGWRALSRLSAAELARLPGLGRARAARLLAVVELSRRWLSEPLRRGAAFRSSLDIFRYFHPRMRDLRVEQFRVVLLDGKHRVLAARLVSQGTLTSSPVHPREVFGPAVRAGAAAVVLVHNHPSGDPAPSADDLDITRRLVEAGELLGIRVLDHVVVGDGTYTSLADRGLLRGR